MAYVKMAYSWKIISHIVMYETILGTVLPFLPVLGIDNYSAKGETTTHYGFYIAL